MRKEMKALDQKQRVEVEAPLSIETHLRGIIYRIEKSLSFINSGNIWMNFWSFYFWPMILSKI